MNILNFTNRIGDLIGKNDLQTAISELREFLQRSPKLDELIIQSARYNDITEQIRLGTVDFENANITKNKIRYAILDLVREIEDNASLNSELKNELESLDEIRIETNIIQNHYGSGDNVGGNKIINTK